MYQLEIKMIHRNSKTNKKIILLVLMETMIYYRTKIYINNICNPLMMFSINNSSQNTTTNNNPQISNQLTKKNITLFHRVTISIRWSNSLKINRNQHPHLILGVSLVPNLVVINPSLNYKIEQYRIPEIEVEAIKKATRMFAFNQENNIYSSPISRDLERRNNCFKKPSKRMLEE